jgi:hypothetical protein
MMRDSEIESWAACHPDQFLFAGVFFGKDYRLNALPRDASGDPLYTEESEVEVMAYVGWLADYLYRQEMPPNHRQLDLCRILSRIPDHEAPRFLGSIAALHHHCLVNVDVKFAVDQLLGSRSTFTEQDIDAIQQRAFRIRDEYDAWASSTEETVMQGVVANEDEGGYSRERIRQYLEEEAEGKAFCDDAELNFCDIPWRVPLSMVLKRVKEKSQRVRLLLSFFEAYAEYADK